MGKLIDISHKLNNEPVFLRLDENHSYKVDDRKNTVLKVMEAWNNPELTEYEQLDKTIELMLGKKPFQEIEKMDLNILSYKEITMALMAIVSGEDIDTLEARFQKATETE